jgi:glycerate 2-kinase
MLQYNKYFIVQEISRLIAGIVVMPILIAPDSFKDCLSAIDVTHALSSGIRSIRSDSRQILFPMSDGGEGATDILNYHLSGHWETPVVSDPLQRKIRSRYLFLNDRNTAVVELAKASGLELLKSHERNPLDTTTYGTGELIRHALDNNAEEVIVAIGGSATVDGGTGIASALGFRFIDSLDREFIPTGGTLCNINRIETTHVHPRYNSTRWLIAADVQNRLIGPEGAARVYGPQKGAHDDAIDLLAHGLEHLAHIIKRDTGFSADDHPGTGAAGGAALFLMAYSNGALRPGFDVLAELTQFHSALNEASVVITGEGKLDIQTQYGKVVSSIAHHSRKHNLPLIVICGTAAGNKAEIQKTLGIDSLYTIRDYADTDEDSISHAKTYLEKIGVMLVRSQIIN